MYQFEIEYSLKDYEAFSRLAAKTVRKKPILIRRIVSAVFTACYFFLAVLWFLLHNWVAGVIFAGLGIFFSVYDIRWHSLTAQRMKKNALKDTGIITIMLEENGVRMCHQKGNSFTPYDAITEAFHFWEYYVFTIDGRQGILCPERALTQGDPAMLKAFLEEKLHQEIKEIH